MMSAEGATCIYSLGLCWICILLYISLYVLVHHHIQLFLISKFKYKESCVVPSLSRQANKV